MSMSVWMVGLLQLMDFLQNSGPWQDDGRSARAGSSGSEDRRGEARQEKLSLDSGKSSQPKSVANDN